MEKMERVATPIVIAPAVLAHDLAAAPDSGGVGVHIDEEKAKTRDGWMMSWLQHEEKVVRCRHRNCNLSLWGLSTQASKLWRCQPCDYN